MIIHVMDWTQHRKFGKICYTVLMSELSKVRSALLHKRLIPIQLYAQSIEVKAFKRRQNEHLHHSLHHFCDVLIQLQVEDYKVIT